jgi:hypothetical protein
MKIEIRDAIQPNFGNHKYIAVVAGEVVATGPTVEQAEANAVRAMYEGYALYYFGTVTPLSKVSKDAL